MLLATHEFQPKWSLKKNTLMHDCVEMNVVVVVFRFDRFSASVTIAGIPINLSIWDTAGKLFKTFDVHKDLILFQVLKVTIGYDLSFIQTL